MDRGTAAKAVDGFRNRIRREAVAATFYDQLDFGTKLTRALNSWAASGRADYEARVALLHAPQDIRLVDQMASRSLRSLRGDVRVDLVPVEEWKWGEEPAGLAAADVLVVAMSPDLLATGFGIGPIWTDGAGVLPSAAGA